MKGHSIEIKKCKTCPKSFPLTTEFWYLVSGKQNKTYWRGSCKECASATDKKWRADNVKRDKLNGITKRVRTAYGITLEEYQKAMASSDKCQICGNPEKLYSASQKLNYDHCHITGKFRGVLCRSCNQAIGQLGDTAESLLKAYTYLKEAEDSAK